MPRSRSRSLSLALAALLAHGAAVAAGCTTARPVSSDKGVTAPPDAAAIDQPRPAPDATALQIAGAVNGLGLDLYAKVRSEPGNIVFSPASIGVALGMVYGGAGGATADDLARTLHVGGVAPDLVHQGFAGLLARAGSSPGTTLKVANRLWAQKDVTWAPSFMSLTRDRYGAPAEVADFAQAAEATRKTINDWVAKATNDRIQDLLPKGSVTNLTVMVLVNAVWFKGQWLQKFAPESTRDAPFTLLDGQEVMVKTMHRRGPARLARIDDVQLLELDYAGGELSMVLALSRAPSPAGGLDALEKRLTSANLDTWLAALREGPDLEIALPRFQAKQNLPLTDLLKQLGLERLFDPERADLSKMLDAQGEIPLYVSGAFHQAFVNVNEEGAEAAAATAIVVATESTGLNRMFRVDRPFVWMIRDKQSGLVLFMGRVVDPR